jgi:hypothetical protein
MHFEPRHWAQKERDAGPQSLSILSNRNTLRGPSQSVTSPQNKIHRDRQKEKKGASETGRIFFLQWAQTFRVRFTGNKFVGARETRTLTRNFKGAMQLLQLCCSCNFRWSKICLRVCCASDCIHVHLLAFLQITKLPAADSVREGSCEGGLAIKKTAEGSTSITCQQLTQIAGQSARQLQLQQSLRVRVRVSCSCNRAATCCSCNRAATVALLI